MTLYCYTLNFGRVSESQTEAEMRCNELEAKETQQLYRLTGLGLIPGIYKSQINKQDIGKVYKSTRGYVVALTSEDQNRAWSLFHQELLQEVECAEQWLADRRSDLDGLSRLYPLLRRCGNSEDKQ